MRGWISSFLYPPKYFFILNTKRRQLRSSYNAVRLSRETGHATGRARFVTKTSENVFDSKGTSSAASRKSRGHFDYKPLVLLLSPESHIRFGCGSRRIKNVFDLYIYYNDHLAKSQLYIFPIFIAAFSGIMPISQFPLSKIFRCAQASHRSNAASIVVVGASLLHPLAAIKHGRSRPSCNKVLILVFF